MKGQLLRVRIGSKKRRKFFLRFLKNWVSSWIICVYEISHQKKCRKLIFHSFLNRFFCFYLNEWFSKFLFFLNKKSISKCFWNGFLIICNIFSKLIEHISYFIKERFFSSRRFSFHLPSIHLGFKESFLLWS